MAIPAQDIADPATASQTKIRVWPAIPDGIQVIFAEIANNDTCLRQRAASPGQLPRQFAPKFSEAFCWPDMANCASMIFSNSVSA